MKKIAFFVEGKTEQFFISKLLREIAGEKNIAIDLRILRGGAKTSRLEKFLPDNQYPNSKYSNPTSPKHEALIYDCGGDNYDAKGKLKSEIVSDIIDMNNNLRQQGYSQIIGLRDLYPMSLSELPKLERGLNFKLSRTPNLLACSIIIAVREIEDWFLSECNHYICIDASLNSALVSSLGFNPCTDDLTTRSNSAAFDLHSIYQLAQKAYVDNNGNKPKNRVERTVECLDYTNLYLNVRHKIPKLNDLITKIDTFLS